MPKGRLFHVSITFSQYENLLSVRVPSPFVIIVFSSLLLMFMLVGSVALLFSVGDTKLPSTLTLAVGGHMKRD
jgi:hypothetical protein